MAKQNTIVGLDVGTTKVAVVVGHIEEGLIKIIGLGVAKNSGLRKGVVVDVEETVSAISAAIEQAERTSGETINSAFVGIGGAHITITESKGVIAVSRADGEIAPSDIDRVVEAARTVAMPPNQEILHVLPKDFIVDGQEQIKDPVGMNGIRLETEALVISGAVSAIKNLTRCVFQAGLEINGLVFSPLADAKALISKKQKELGIALVNLGAGTTEFAIFEEDDLIGAGVIPVGSMHITNDIAIGLRTNIDAAERIKIKEGSANPESIRETETVEMSKFDPHDNQKVPRKYLSEIIQARLSEIFNLIREQLHTAGKDGMLPAGIVLTGGGSKLEGLVKEAKEGLRLPVQIGKIFYPVEGIIDKINDPIYSTSVGLMLWGLEEQDHGSSRRMNIGNFGGALERAKDFFKQFLP